jgi:hypothetical protein
MHGEGRSDVGRARRFLAPDDRAEDQQRAKGDEAGGSIHKRTLKEMN